MDAVIPQVLADAAPAGFRFRRLELEDYQKGFYQLLGNLTQVGEVTEEVFANTFAGIQSQRDTYLILVLEECETQRLAASGTLLVEQKFIRNAGKVGHIEDIVVSPDFQRRGLGKFLIQTLAAVARAAHCYKVILDCSDDLVPFYEKCGLTNKGAFMAQYF